LKGSKLLKIIIKIIKIIRINKMLDSLYFKKDLLSKRFRVKSGYLILLITSGSGLLYYASES
jgi:hypothetical protein